MRTIFLPSDAAINATYIYDIANLLADADYDSGDIYQYTGVYTACTSSAGPGEHSGGILLATA